MNVKLSIITNTCTKGLGAYSHKTHIVSHFQTNISSRKLLPKYLLLIWVHWSCVAMSRTWTYATTQHAEIRLPNELTSLSSNHYQLQLWFDDQKCADLISCSVIFVITRWLNMHGSCEIATQYMPCCLRRNLYWFWIVPISCGILCIPSVMFSLASLQSNFMNVLLDGL